MLQLDKVTMNPESCPHCRLIEAIAEPTVLFPADPPFNAYPAVIGAAVGGMIVATIGTMLLFMFIVRNRNRNPRKCDRSTSELWITCKWDINAYLLLVKLKQAKFIAMCFHFN